jgi:hypothetical protein
MCESIKLPGGGGAIVCGGRAPAPRCQIRGCRRGGEALCDHQLEGYRDGRTCSVRICELHRTRTGPDTDLCPYHAAAARRAAEHR